MSADDLKKKDQDGKPAPRTLTGQDLLYVAGHSACAMIFIFVLQFYVLKAPMQTALMWALMFGAFAFTIAFGQARRRR